MSATREKTPLVICMPWEMGMLPGTTQALCSKCGIEIGISPSSKTIAASHGGAVEYRCILFVPANHLVIPLTSEQIAEILNTLERAFIAAARADFDSIKAKA